MSEEDRPKETGEGESPVIAERLPAVIELDAGVYFWCVCGESANQPFCDGSHKGSSFRPMKFELAESKRVALCQCKHTEGAPYCDGTHSRLD